ncbi:MAG: hypothetical protein MUQ10_10130, partial [Anaerolineae bacterium]|nr:hypothetical protein [Anaerolineae bacterium]
QGLGIEAFRMLIPAEWEFQGGVQWMRNNPGKPAVVAFRAFNPKGVECFEAFPNIACYWTNNQTAMGMTPVGSLYYGNEARPPAPVLQVLRELVVPRYRGASSGLEIVGEQPLPDLVQQMRANSPAAPTGVTSAGGGKLRLRYQMGDHVVEEDLYGVVEMSRQSTPMMMGFMGAMEQIFWMASYLFACRAHEGTLDGLSDTFMGLVRSFKICPEWYARYVQVSQGMIQGGMQQIANAGRISQIISQTTNEISDMMMDGYYQRQATMDHLADQFSQATRGVDGGRDSFENAEVELPGGFEHAWANALGEYIVTDDSNFDPSVEVDGDWKPMRRTDI